MSCLCCHVWKAIWGLSADVWEAYPEVLRCWSILALVLLVPVSAAAAAAVLSCLHCFCGDWWSFALELLHRYVVRSFFSRCWWQHVSDLWPIRSECFKGLKRGLNQSFFVRIRAPVCAAERAAGVRALYEDGG